MPAVAVTVAKGDAEHPWRHQGAIHSNDREPYRHAVIGSQSGKSDTVRDLVKSRRSELRGLEADP